jgi:hypothetical protein
MEIVRLGVARLGSGWSVTHNGGHLGQVRTRDEALKIARMLADWSAAQGRSTHVDLPEAPRETRSFAGPA